MARRWPVMGASSGKPSASVRIETETVLAELVVWVSGEAEMTYARIPGAEPPSVDQYDLTGRLGLEGCLDDLERHLGLERL